VCLVRFDISIEVFKVGILREFLSVFGLNNQITCEKKNERRLYIFYFESAARMNTIIAKEEE